MMHTIDTKLLGSAAAIALFATMPTAAFAFDTVDWTWNNTVEERVNINVNVRSNLAPTGLTQVEKLQIQIGDVNAESRVSGITNNQPTGATGTGTGTFSEVFDFTTMTDDVPDPSLVMGPVAGIDDGASTVTATLLDGGTLDEGTDILNFQVEVAGTVSVDPADSFDAAVELPTIDSAATAVGNNQAINSDVATMLHDSQMLFDTRGPGAEFDEADLVGAVAAFGLGAEFGGNSHTALAVGAGVLGIAGTIVKAEVDATSEVLNIINARVDSAATAVGNNMSVNVNADGSPRGDSVLVADITQFGLADLNATSTVRGVTVGNYTNLASVGPLVGSAATAVGNNVSINVGSVGSDL